MRDQFRMADDEFLSCVSNLKARVENNDALRREQLETEFEKMTNEGYMTRKEFEGAKRELYSLSAAEVSRMHSAFFPKHPPKWDRD